MRIYDPKEKRVVEGVTLFLTQEEARELGHSALQLAKSPEQHHHHINDSEYRREITVAVYTPENLSVS